MALGEGFAVFEDDGEGLVEFEGLGDFEVDEGIEDEFIDLDEFEDGGFDAGDAF